MNDYYSMEIIMKFLIHHYTLCYMHTQLQVFGYSAELVLTAMATLSNYELPPHCHLVVHQDNTRMRKESSLCASSL